MEGEVQMYKDGRFKIENEVHYSRIKDGDRIVVVDNKGNKMDFGDLMRRYSREQDDPITFTASTESQNQYYHKKSAPDGPHSKEPSEKWWEKTKFNGDTEMRSQYVPKESDRQERAVHQPQARPNVKFDGTTEARAQYVPKRVEGENGQPHPKEPADKWWEKTKFTGDTEMRTQFVPKEVEKSNRYEQGPRANYDIPGRKFDGTTEMRAQYVPKEAPRDQGQPHSKEPADKWWEKTKFHGDSEMRSQFVPKESERPERAVYQPHARPQLKFDGTTEQRAQYTPKKTDNPSGQPHEKQPADKWWEKTRFHGDTEARSQFVPKEIERPERADHRPPARPPQKFDGTTESRAQYVPKEASRDNGPPHSKEPADKWWEKTKFSGDTEMRTQFVPKESDRQERAVHQPQARPQLKFDGTTEQRAQFVPKSVEGNGYPSSNQPGEKWWEKTKFDGDTEMRSQYVPKEIDRAAPRTYQQPNLNRPMIYIEPSLGEARDSMDSQVTGSSLGHDRR